MTRPGHHKHYIPTPGLHHLDHHHNDRGCSKEEAFLLYDVDGFNILTESGYRIALFVAGSCEGVLCGPNEHCNKGCCVCDAGYERDSSGKCVPIPWDNNIRPPEEPEVPGLPIRPIAANPILQDPAGYIYTEGFSVINYDFIDHSNNPCYGVTCPPGEICSGGVCVPDPGYDPCENVVCGPNEVCSNGTCIPDPNYDPCEGVVCGVGRICENGICVVDPNYDPCDGVVCGVGQICSDGICIPDPNYNPCLGVFCSTGYVCEDGNCIRSPLSKGVTQEDGGLILTSNDKILNYD